MLHVSKEVSKIDTLQLFDNFVFLNGLFLNRNKSENSRASGDFEQEARSHYKIFRQADAEMIDRTRNKLPLQKKNTIDVKKFPKDTLTEECKRVTLENCEFENREKKTFLI